jgi:hypothetical protein
MSTHRNPKRVTGLEHIRRGASFYAKRKPLAPRAVAIRALATNFVTFVAYLAFGGWSAGLALGFFFVALMGVFNAPGLILWWLRRQRWHRETSWRLKYYVNSDGDFVAIDSQPIYAWKSGRMGLVMLMSRILDGLLHRLFGCGVFET